ncbi:MAG: molybdopterin-synthase sulfurylase [Verrucomicrobiales bacterium]|nr:molybdopterin-synthase sulfurylase [Verrucomicrobiales bacterium]
MPMERVLQVMPGAQRALFRKFHLGGCSSCAFQPGETIEQLAQRSSLNANEIISHLEKSHEADLELLVEPKELAKILPTVRLIDVRSREEYEAVHLDGAVLMSQSTMQEILSKWPREQGIVIYDHRGNQGLDAAAYFLGQGFKNVRTLRGGLDAWSKEVDAKIPRYKLELA